MASAERFFPENYFNSVTELVLANPCGEIIQHVKQGLDDIGVNSAYFETIKNTVLPIQRAAEQKVFSGQSYQGSYELSQYALVGAAKERTIKEPIPDIELKIKFIEANQAINQERSIPIYIYVGKEKLSMDEFAKLQKEKSDNYYVKFVGFLSSEWLWPLGLDYDFQKGSIVNKQTREIPSLQQIEQILQSPEQAKARDSFVKMAKTRDEHQQPLMAENSDFIVKLTVVDTEHRQRATPI